MKKAVEEAKKASAEVAEDEALHAQLQCFDKEDYEAEDYEAEEDADVTPTPPTPSPPTSPR